MMPPTKISVRKPPKAPQVPGALGRYPRPNQVARRSEMCGLGPRVECAVLGSVDAVIALRVSQQAEASQILISEERFGGRTTNGPAVCNALQATAITII